MTIDIAALPHARPLPQPASRRLLVQRPPAAARSRAGMALALQRSVGNAATRQLLSLQPLVLQRCGPTPCDCSPEEREAYASSHPTQSADRTAPHPDESDDGQPLQRMTTPLTRFGLGAKTGSITTAADPVVQRQDRLREDDPRLDDPGFLICLAFCYLGIPPSMFKDLVQGMLECISGELQAAGGNYDERFRSARDELATYSKVRLLGKIFRFLMHGELGPAGIIRVTARTQAVRDRILARLVAMGATHAGLVAAEAIVRKVLLVVDAVIVAGCATYCGADQIARRLVELTDAIAQGIAAAAEIAGTIREGIAGLLGDAVMNIYGQLDPVNWALNPSLPERTRADLSATGMTLWALVRPGSPWTTRRPGRSDADELLTNAVRTLAQQRVPRELMVSVAAALQATIRASGGSARITADQLMGMSAVGLVAFLRDNGLLTFREDPISFATREIDAGAASSASATP